MKSFLLYAIFAITFLASAKAECPEDILKTMNDCVRIRTDARDTFCATKQSEIFKCNCVYDTLIDDCYDYCPDEPTIQTAKQQLEADTNSQCASAGLDPKSIPANVYNEITEGKTDIPLNSDNTPNGTNQNQGSSTSTSQSTLTSEDYNDGAETTKICAALLIANALLALLL
ncbi:hypothetical protein BCR36DRAFT_581657 [Piromyces finnis]|uniref:GPI anchored serine-threonine rich protein n=1 Tax=Piromyces finnis TaxID=1754191 RepID=A0A1Y1VF74_9FUNG|nr:hypothetical protein BCR36DRAFT_581657 [Piromyces finnis]|eukprot:ORX54766.1 hypothetical protein BCR36DRAFT_581657 [Piromyces finnis]